MSKIINWTVCLQWKVANVSMWNIGCSNLKITCLFYLLHLNAVQKLKQVDCICCGWLEILIFYRVVSSDFGLLTFLLKLQLTCKNLHFKKFDLYISRFLWKFSIAFQRTNLVFSAMKFLFICCILSKGHWREIDTTSKKEKQNLSNRLYRKHWPVRDVLSRVGVLLRIRAELRRSEFWQVRQTRFGGEAF